MNDFTEVLQMLTAALALLAALLSLRNGIRATRMEKAQVEIKENVATIEKATNSMKDALVAATGKAALAEGTAAGLVEGHAAGLDQGRNEERKAPV